MPNGKGTFALVDNKNQLYSDYYFGEEFDLNNTLSLGMNYIMNAASNYIPSTADESYYQQYLDMLGLKLKYYDDSNVMTIVGSMKHDFDIYSYSYSYETQREEKNNLAKGTIEATIKLQFKVVKVVKVRASIEGSVVVDYFRDNHISMYSSLLGITGLSGECFNGDKETINLKASAGVNLETKKVENKLPDLSSYKNVSTNNNNGYSYINYEWK